MGGGRCSCDERYVGRGHCVNAMTQTYKTFIGVLMLFYFCIASTLFLRPLSGTMLLAQQKLYHFALGQLSLKTGIN